MIPVYTKEAIDLYVSDGIPTGSFVYAVLTNNLFDAVARADSTNIMFLREICQYIYNDIPSNCWGSQEKVNNWLEMKRYSAEANND